MTTGLGISVGSFSMRAVRRRRVDVAPGIALNGGSLRTRRRRRVARVGRCRAYLLVLLCGALLAASSARAADPMSWGSPTLIDPHAALSCDGVAGCVGAPPSGPISVSCPAISFCAAIDGSGYVVTSVDPAGGAASWTSFPVASALSGISCPSPSLCVAVGPADVATSTNPISRGSWTAAPIDTQNPLTAVSCPSASLCVAVGAHGTIATSTDPTGGPAAWTVSQVSVADIGGCGHYGPVADCRAPLLAVSCPSVSLCVAVDDPNGPMPSGDVVSSTDPSGRSSVWKVTPIDAYVGLTGVSCPSLSWCVAVDYYGDGFASRSPTGDAAAWTPAFRSNGWDDAVSCGSVTLCVETAGTCCNPLLPSTAPTAGFVDTSTDPLAGASAWTLSELAPNLPDGFDAVSCFSTRMCVVVGASGNAVVGRPPTPTKIRAALRHDITPPHRTTRINGLLRHSGASFAVKALGAGRLHISWFSGSTPGHLARAERKPILVAAGDKTFNRTGTGKINLKLTPSGKTLLKHNHSLNLTVKGIFIPIDRTAVVVSGNFVLSH